jgi:hypothetical protein
MYRVPVHIIDADTLVQDIHMEPQTAAGFDPGATP